MAEAESGGGKAVAGGTEEAGGKEEEAKSAEYAIRWLWAWVVAATGLLVLGIVVGSGLGWGLEHHENELLYISVSVQEQPESCYFGLCLALAMACLSPVFAALVIRHASRVLLVLSIVIICGGFVVATVQIDAVYFFHNAGATAMFGAATAFITWEVLLAHARTGLSRIVTARGALAAVANLLFVVCGITGVIREVDRSQHTAASISFGTEWVLAGVTIVAILTYALDLRQETLHLHISHPRKA